MINNHRRNRHKKRQPREGITHFFVLILDIIGHNSARLCPAKTRQERCRSRLSSSEFEIPKTESYKYLLEKKRTETFIP